MRHVIISLVNTQALDRLAALSAGRMTRWRPMRARSLPSVYKYALESPQLPASLRTIF